MSMPGFTTEALVSGMSQFYQTMESLPTRADDAIVSKSSPVIKLQ